MKEHSRYEMKACGALIKRNVTMFFKDKGTFFTSLITPMILLVLYATFLSNVYEDSFRAALPAELFVEDSLINGLVGGIATFLAVGGQRGNRTFLRQPLYGAGSCNGRARRFVDYPRKKFLFGIRVLFGNGIKRVDYLFLGVDLGACLPFRYRLVFVLCGRVIVGVGRGNLGVVRYGVVLVGMLSVKLARGNLGGWLDR